MILEGLLINAPRFIIGAVLVVPTIKFNNGISINEPPPPLTVDIEKVITPAINKTRINKKSMLDTISVIY